MNGKYEKLILGAVFFAGCIFGSVTKEALSNPPPSAHNQEFDSEVHRLSIKYGHLPQTLCATWWEEIPKEPLYGEFSSMEHRTMDGVCFIKGETVNYLGK